MLKTEKVLRKERPSPSKKYHEIVARSNTGKPKQSLQTMNSAIGGFHLPEFKEKNQDPNFNYFLWQVYSRPLVYFQE